jgi:hypothetical protein
MEIGGHTIFDTGGTHEIGSGCQVGF